ncbi:MAG: outer membrane protein assembly factor BamA [Planctomycetes bacterium]|nr:outer membrane protein assembly factor BamA [Planctomycetota bacterium]
MRGVPLIVFCLLLGNLSAVQGSAVRIGAIVIEGNTLTSERFIRKNIRTREGEDFNPQILNEDVKRLYESGRFTDVSVAHMDAEGQLKIVISVKEKPKINKILFKGYDRLKTSAFNEEIKSKEGERYDEGILSQDKKIIEQIYRDKGYLFSEIKASLVESGKKDEVDLVFEIKEMYQVKIAEVNFTGNDHVSDATLRKLMEVKRDRFFSSGVYDSDKFSHDLTKLQGYYRRSGYLDAKVTQGKSSFSENKKWLYLQVEVQEGPLYVVDRIDIQGNRIVSNNGLLEKIRLKEGMPYSDFGLQDQPGRLELEDNIEKYYGEIGRIFTEVRSRSIIDEKNAHVTIAAEVVEGDEIFVEQVKVEGNVKTADVIIRRELTFFPLERVNTSLIRESYRNLMNLGFFEEVKIEPEPGSRPDLANIVVRVKEKQTGSINFSVGFSSIESIFAMIKYSQRNFDWRDEAGGVKSLFTGEGFMGDGQNFDITLNIGTETRRTVLSFTEPWVFNRKIRFGFGFFNTASSISDFDESRTGGFLNAGREFFKNFEGSLSYRIEEIEISNIQVGVSPAIMDQAGRRQVSSINNEWVYDCRDNRFFPSRGWTIQIGEMLAGGPLGGEQDFYKLEAEAKAYKKLFDWNLDFHHVLSGRVRLGLADSYLNTVSVPIWERYFVGGLGSVRGFANRSLGPKELDFETGGSFMSVANVEYTFPIQEKTIWGVLFYDQGYAWKEASDFRMADLRSSVGVGLRIQIDALGPFPISLDFAKPVRSKIGDETETFFFNFGNFF